MQLLQEEKQKTPTPLPAPEDAVKEKAIATQEVEDSFRIQQAREEAMKEAAIQWLTKVPPEEMLSMDYIELLMKSPEFSQAEFKDFTGNIRSHSVDYDGHGEHLGPCPDNFVAWSVQNQKTQDRLKQLPIKEHKEYAAIAQDFWKSAQETLTLFLVKDTKGTLTLFFSGSNRQDALKDRSNALEKQNGSSFVQFKRFCEAHKFTFCPLLLADIDNYTRLGVAMKRLELTVRESPGKSDIETRIALGEDHESAEISILANLLKNIDDYFNKIRLTANQMHYAARAYPNCGRITHCFSDDRRDILDVVKGYFLKFPQLIPPKVKLEFYHGNYEIPAIVPVPFPAVHEVLDKKTIPVKPTPRDKPLVIKIPTVIEKKNRVKSPTSPMSAFLDELPMQVTTRLVSPKVDTTDVAMRSILFLVDADFSAYLKLSAAQIENFKQALRSYQQMHPSLQSVSLSDINALMVFHKLLKIETQVSSPNFEPAMSSNDEFMLSLIEKYIHLQLALMSLEQETWKTIDLALQKAQADTQNLENITKLCDQLLSDNNLFFSSLAGHPPLLNISEKLSYLALNFTNLEYWLQNDNLVDINKTRMFQDLRNVLSSIQLKINALSAELSQSPVNKDAKKFTGQKGGKEPLLGDIENIMAAFHSLYISYCKGFAQPDFKTEGMKMIGRCQSTLEAKYAEFIDLCKKANLIETAHLPKDAKEANELAKLVIEKLKDKGAVSEELQHSILNAAERLYKLRTEVELIRGSKFNAGFYSPPSSHRQDNTQKSTPSPTFSPPLVHTRAIGERSR